MPRFGMTEYAALGAQRHTIDAWLQAEGLLHRHVTELRLDTEGRVGVTRLFLDHDNKPRLDASRHLITIDETVNVRTPPPIPAHLWVRR